MLLSPFLTSFSYAKLTRSVCSARSNTLSACAMCSSTKCPLWQPYCLQSWKIRLPSADGLYPPRHVRAELISLDCVDAARRTRTPSAIVHPVTPDVLYAF